MARGARRSRPRALGAGVSELHSPAEIGEPRALRVAAVSYGERLCFGFCADPGIVDDLDALVEAAEREAAALSAA